MLASRVAPSLSPLRRSVNGCKAAGVVAVRSKSTSTQHRPSKCLSSTIPTTISQQRQGGDNVLRATMGESVEDGEKTKGARRYFAGALASIVAASMLIREGLLPDVFFEWDSEVQWEEVHQLAQVSNITNKPHAVIQKRFESFGYRGKLVVRDLPEAPSRYFVHTGHVPGGEGKRVHHVAIRGTVSLSDLNTDFKTRLEFDEECGCVFHAGFKKVADAVASDIETYLEPGTPIKLTGHSLGGAVATILAAKLKLRGYTIGKVLTFGTPKVTDAQGAERLGDSLPLLRVTHERDPVPLLPFARTDWKVALADQEEITGTALDVTDFAARHDEEDRGDGRDSGGEMVGEAIRMAADRNGAGKRRATASTMAYAHFGSQVILIQREGCMECRREQNSSPSGGDVGLGGTGAAPSLSLVPWDDTWGPELFGPDNTEAMERVSRPIECDHSPSKARSYYDPHGDDGCTFDTAWARLSNMYYMHRMNTYESEVSQRRDEVSQRSLLLPLGQGGEALPQEGRRQQGQAEFQERRHRDIGESERALAV